MRKPAAQRFWAKVNRDGPLSAFRPDLGNCWLWTGCVDRDGYGQFHVGSIAEKTLKYVRVHRWVYEAYVSPIPEGFVIDHLCRVTNCVRPTHLEAVTNQENLRRGFGHGSETHCPKGHSYDERNTYIDCRGKRHCRACGRVAAKGRRDAAYWREWRRRKKAKVAA